MLRQENWFGIRHLLSLTIRMPGAVAAEPTQHRSMPALPQKEMCSVAIRNDRLTSIRDLESVAATFRYRADCGRSRGGPCRGAIRPSETIGMP